MTATASILRLVRLLVVARCSHVLGMAGNFVFCTACGAWSQTRHSNLLKVCPQVAGGFRRHLLMRLLDGLHPTTANIIWHVQKNDDALELFEAGS